MSLLEDEKKAEERAKAVTNERAKLSATYVNGLAIALVAVGTLSPAVSSSPATPRATLIQAAVGLVCLVASLILHLQARRGLGEMK